MRFSPEGDHGANAGLRAARDFLDPIKGTSTHISNSDLLFGLPISQIGPLLTISRTIPLDKLL